MQYLKVNKLKYFNYFMIIKMEYDSKGFIWFMLIFNAVVITVAVFNIINFNNVLKDEDDNTIGLSRNTVTAFYWLNIILAAISGYVFLYTLVKALLGKENIEKAANLIPEYFRKKASSVYVEAKQVGATSVEATQAAAIAATLDAINQNKSLKESMKIGVVAGTEAGVAAGFDKGDAKIIAKLGTEKAINEKLSKYIKKKV
jgi:hypothetical protein